MLFGYVESPPVSKYRASAGQTATHGKIIVTGTSDELKNKLGKDLIYLETNDNKNAAEILRSLESVKSVTEDTKSLRIMEFSENA